MCTDRQEDGRDVILREYQTPIAGLVITKEVVEVDVDDPTLGRFFQVVQQIAG